MQGLSSIGTRADASVIGVDIGASSIKLVQLRASRGTAILETYGEIALGPYAEQSIGKTVKLPPEKIAEALTDLMKEANVTAHEGGISIPFSSSLVVVLDLPKVDAESMKRIVPIEARKYIPSPVSEVALDWFIIPPQTGPEVYFSKRKTPKLSDITVFELGGINLATSKFTKSGRKYEVLCTDKKYISIVAAHIAALLIIIGDVPSYYHNPIGRIEKISFIGAIQLR